MRERAISVRQPYAELILSGEKRFEYRSRPTNIRGRVLLYASMKPADTPLWDKLDVTFDELPHGVVVGSVEIVDCLYFANRGDYGYALANARRIRRPYKPNGTPQPLFFWCDKATSKQGKRT